MTVRVKFLLALALLGSVITSFVYYASTWTLSSQNIIEDNLPKSTKEKEAMLGASSYLAELPNPLSQAPEEKKNEPFLKLAVPTASAYFAVDIKDHEEATAFEIKVRKKVAVYNHYIYWGEKGNGFDTFLAERLYKDKQSLLITWNPSKSVRRNPIDQPEYRLSRILEGKYDYYLDAWVKELKKWKRPVIIRFAPEMNGNWLPWGTDFTNSEEYIKTYRYVVDSFRRAGVKNVSWMWSPNEAAGTRMLDFYPGDEYVDWVGISGFNWGNTTYARWRSMEQIFQESMLQLQGIDKPIALAELGSVEDPTSPGAKAQWIASGLENLKTAYPKVKMIVWSNGKSFDRYDWRVDTTQGSLEAFRNAIADPYYSGSIEVVKAGD